MLTSADIKQAGEMIKGIALLKMDLAKAEGERDALRAEVAWLRKQVEERLAHDAQ